MLVPILFECWLIVWMIVFVVIVLIYGFSYLGCFVFNCGRLLVWWFMLFYCVVCLVVLVGLFSCCFVGLQLRGFCLWIALRWLFC